jgi:hypothetical protein
MDILEGILRTFDNLFRKGYLNYVLYALIALAIFILFKSIR